MNVTAVTQRRWTIRGRYPNGSRLQSNVLAFDHHDAAAAADKRKGGAIITDIVLRD